MRVFVTGATGFVGSAVVQELIGAGHQVLGLARSEASAKTLTDVGAEVHSGSLDDLNSLQSGASAADGVIHCAFNHDFSKFAENCELDRRAIEAIGAALEGSDRPLLVTSGVALLTTGPLGTEDDAPVPPSPSYPRASEATAEALVARGVRAATVRLPPSVHGSEDKYGFVPLLIKLAREKGVAAYVGDGSNRWPAVHQIDAALAYRLALEKNLAGARYHALTEEGVPMRAIAEAIGRQLNLSTASKSPEEAGEHFGWMAHFAALDWPTSSAQTQALLDWHPTQPTLLDDLNQPYYFENR